MRRNVFCRLLLEIIFRLFLEIISGRDFYRWCCQFRVQIPHGVEAARIARNSSCYAVTAKLPCLPLYFVYITLVTLPLADRTRMQSLECREAFSIVTIDI